MCSAISTISRWIHPVASTYSIPAGETCACSTAPAVSELDVSPEGWIWARRAGDSNGSTWDVMDHCGVHLGSASVPYPVAVTEVGPSGVIHAVASDPLGIDHVMTLRLDAEVSRRSC